MSARHRSDRLLSNRRNASTWNHVPSMVKAEAAPCGLKSMRFGATRSFVVVPRCAATSDQSTGSGGSAGLSIERRSPARSAPSSGDRSLLIPVSTPEAIERIRASAGTACSASGASTAKVL